MVPLAAGHSVTPRVRGWMLPFSVKNLQSRGNSSRFSPDRFLFQQMGGGGLWTQLHHRTAQKTRFYVLQDGFQSLQLLLRLPTQGDACGYAPCNSHCFQMPSQPICYPPFTKYNRSIKVFKVRRPCMKVVLKWLVTVQSEGGYKVMLPLKEWRAVVFYQASQLWQELHTPNI